MKSESYLDGILTPEQRAKGLSLEEDDHSVRLMHERTQIAVFGIRSTVAGLREEAERYLNRAGTGSV